MKKLIFIFFFIFFTTFLAADPIPSDIYVLEKANFPLEKVIDNSSFKKLDNLYIFLNKVFKDEFWLKISYKNTEKKDIKKTIVFFWNYASLNLYYVKKSEVFKTSKLLDSDRTGIVFDKFSLKKNESMDLYIRVNKNIGYQFFKSLKIIDESKYIKLIANFESLYQDGLFFGILLTVFFYNFILYFSIKLKAILYYCFFILSILIFISDIPFAFFDWLRVKNDYIQIYREIFLSTLTLISFSFFSKYFFETNKNIYFKKIITIYNLSILFTCIYLFIIYPSNGIRFPLLLLPIFTIIGFSFIKEYRYSGLLYVISSLFIFFPFVYNEITIFFNYSTTMNAFEYIQITTSLSAILLTFSIHLNIDKITKQKAIYERQVLEKSKYAAMGKMIGNIAHQWRQPLNIVASILMSVQARNTLDTLSKEDLELRVKEANLQLTYMSKTIDDFLNFFSKEKNITQFKLSDVINSALLLVNSSFLVNKITVEIEIENDAEIETYKNELIQSLTIILNNAKDALLNIDKSRHISILIKNKKIYIEDNGGGINEKIIDKIFEPYFSTKKKKHGVGLGLYTAKTIIGQNIEGELFCINGSKGAIFIIDLSNL